MVNSAWSGSDLIVVDEEGDNLAGVLTASWLAQGVEVRRYRLCEASQLFTVRVRGGEAAVEPGVPLLLRPLRGLPPGASADRRFMHAESFAAIWAAAALTPAHVVNRPDAWGYTSRASASVIVTQRRSGWIAEQDTEYIWHRLAPSGPELVHQDIETWALTQDPAATSFGRSRSVLNVAGWEQVIVVGSVALRTSEAGLCSLDLEVDSLAVARALSLTFATVSWAVSMDLGSAVLARVNPFPTLPECIPVLSEVSDRLLQELTTP